MRARELAGALGEHARRAHLRRRGSGARPRSALGFVEHDVGARHVGQHAALRQISRWRAGSARGPAGRLRSAVSSSFTSWRLMRKALLVAPALPARSRPRRARRAPRPSRRPRSRSAAAREREHALDRQWPTRRAHRSRRRTSRLPRRCTSRSAILTIAFTRSATPSSREDALPTRSRARCAADRAAAARGSACQPTCATTAPAPTSDDRRKNGTSVAPSARASATRAAPPRDVARRAAGPTAASQARSTRRLRAHAGCGAPHVATATTRRSSTATGATSGDSATCPCLRASSRRLGVALGRSAVPPSAMRRALAHRPPSARRERARSARQQAGT